MQAFQQRRSKVNGKYLRQYGGKNITIMGEIIKVNHGSNTFEMRSTDGCIINVIMNEPFSELVEGWVEVRGTAQGRNNILGDDYLVFPKHMVADFDSQLYDDVITAINTFNNPWVNSD